MEINLIRERHIKPRQALSRRLLALGLFLPVILFSLLAAGFMARSNRAIVSRYERALAEQEYRERQEIARLLKPAADDERNLALLESALERGRRRGGEAVRLALVAELLPSGCHLESVDISGSSIHLLGRGGPGAATASSLARFVNRLNRDPEFRRGAAELRLNEVFEESGSIIFQVSNESVGTR